MMFGGMLKFLEDLYLVTLIGNQHVVHDLINENRVIGYRIEHKH